MLNVGSFAVAIIPHRTQSVKYKGALTFRCCCVASRLVVCFQLKTFGMKLKLLYVFFLAALFWPTASWISSVAVTQHAGNSSPISIWEGNPSLSQTEPDSTKCHNLRSPCSQETECEPTSCPHVSMASQPGWTEPILSTKDIHTAYALASLGFGPVPRPPRT